MPKYRKKAAKKAPYEKQFNLLLPRTKFRFQQIVNNHKLTLLRTKLRLHQLVNSHKLLLLLVTSVKSTQNSVSSVHCGFVMFVHSSISEELLDVVGDIQSLHWFYSTCDAVVSDFIVNSSATNSEAVIDQKLKARLCQKVDNIEKSLKVITHIWKKWSALTCLL